MASGDQADTSQKPSGKKAKKLSQKEQSERFIETARNLGADEGAAKFSNVIDLTLGSPEGEGNGSQKNKDRT